MKYWKLYSEAGVIHMPGRNLRKALSLAHQLYPSRLWRTK